MTMSIAEVLANTLSQEHQVRADASHKLETYARDSFPSYVAMLCQELANDQTPSHIRSAAGIALKNTLMSRDTQRKEEMAARWVQLDPSARGQIKMAILQTLGSVDAMARSTSAQVIAAIAEIELPRNEWAELITTLLENVTTTTRGELKQASLQTIGFVCEQICESTNPDVLAPQANQILTAVAQGARKEEPSQDVRLAAIVALYNSLDFIKENFEREGERNYIMQVVCEATQSTEVQVQIAAFECLVRIMHNYYDKMAMYMQKALFGLTVMGMKHDNEKVALQAVEFWSTVCEEEIEIQTMIAEGIDPTQHGSPAKCHGFAHQAVQELVPVLLWLLTKKEEDDDEDEWNISMSAASCLQLLAACVEDAIVPHVVPFVENNIRNGDWRFREAAIMAFGSILEGPSNNMTGPLVAQALPVLIEMMKDTVPQVKDTTAWTLGKIAEYLCECIKPDLHLPAMMQAVLAGLADTPRIASHCAWCIMNLAEGFISDEDAATSPLSPYFEPIITSLLTAADRSHQDPNFRAAAYEAVSVSVTNAAKDCDMFVNKLAVVIIERLEQTMVMQTQIVNLDDKITHQEIQANLCHVLTSIVRRLGSEIAPNADRIMAVLLQIISNASRSSTVLEDALLTIGSLSTALEGSFIRYIDAFLPILCQAIQNPEEHQTCSIAIAVFGDICRALNENVFASAQQVMPILMELIQSPNIHLELRPSIVSCFGDVALAISDKFEMYLGGVIGMLMGACGASLNEEDEDLIDYLLQLRESIIEAFTGIVQGMKSGNKVLLLHGHVGSILDFIQRACSSPDSPESLIRQSVGLIGDIADSFPPRHFQALFSHTWIDEMLKEARQMSPSTKNVAKWAKEKIRLQRD